MAWSSKCHSSLNTRVGVRNTNGLFNEDPLIQDELNVSGVRD